MTETIGHHIGPYVEARFTHDELVRAVEEHGGIAQAARALKIPRTTLQSRLASSVSTLRRHEESDGSVVLEWTKQPAPKQGDKEREQALVAAVEHVLSRHTPLPLIAAPVANMDDLLTVYIIADHHLMMLAWAPESGENYDLAIAEHVLKDTMQQVVAATPPTRRAVVLNLGDFFHADDNSARTALHGNQLAVEGRFDKALQLGADMHVWMVELALQKHEQVELRILPGNHDTYASKALNLAMRFAFMNNPRVNIDFDPSVFWHMTFGKTMIAAHHGHQVKPAQMPGVMAGYWPQEWGNTTHRYALLGHIHHGSVGGDERGGARWETFQTMAAKDEYAYGNGYMSGRSMTAVIYHFDGGEDGRVVKQVRFKA